MNKKNSATNLRSLPKGTIVAINGQSAAGSTYVPPKAPLPKVTTQSKPQTPKK